MFPIVLFHGFFEIGKSIVYRLIVWHINLGRCGPQHNDTRTIVFGLELTNVFTQLLNHFPTGSAIFYIITVETFGIFVIESSLHRDDFLQLVFYRIDVFFFQNLGIDG